MTQRIKATDSKRLATNTIFLYIRTLLVMAITLFTSRVILASLGINDYGTYNVIGGFVAMFSLLGGTLVKATQRFINVELGKTEDSNPNKVFCTAMGIHGMLAIILFILLESFGLWFLNAKMNIPEGRMFAANIVYQCSVVSFLLHIITMPYNAVIIAFERMKAFAYISLIDASLKLAISYGLYLTNQDRLIIYAILLLTETVFLASLYVSYCKRHFPDVIRFQIIKEKNAYIRQTSFAGYTFLGSIAAILATQGVTVLLNIFGGVVVSAARGIAVQIQQAVTKFSSDFMTALNPQITKSYASGDLDKSMNLVYRGARFSFFLILILATPIYAKIEVILDLWLENYPDTTVTFARLTLIYSLITTLSNTIITEILATGHLRSNAFIIGGLRIFILPVCYIVLKMGSPIHSVYYVLITIDTISLFTRLIILRSLTGVGIIGYVKNVITRVLMVSAVVVMLNVFLNFFFSDTVRDLIIYSLLSGILTAITVFCIGLTTAERSYFISVFRSKIFKK